MKCMRIALMLIFGLLPGSLGFAAEPKAVPAQPPVRVVLAVDPRLPSVPQPVIEEALRIASNWIEVWYQKRVHFKIDRTVPVNSYQSSYFKKLPILEQWKKYPYALDGSDTVARFLLQQTEVLRTQSMPVLKSYVPDSLKSRITSPEDAAKNLLEVYDQKVKLWKSLRTSKGIPFFDTSYPQKHSYWYWERAMQSVWPDKVTDYLIITNVMLLDDSISDAPPHSLLRGGLLNGMALEESPQTLVSTFAIFTDIPAVSDLRDTTELSAKDRVLALAHIIAHEFGTHVLQGYKDVYDHTACLAVPTSGLAYSSTLQRLLHQGSPCKLAHPLLDRRKTLTDRYENLAHRYLAVKNYSKAREAVARALALEPTRPLLKLMLRQLDAKKKK